MKSLFLIGSCFLSFLLFSQSKNGFTIISTGNIVMSNSDHFALTSGTKGSKLKQVNTFNFSFKDSILIHTPGAYKDKEGKHEMISQVYKISHVEAVVDKNGVDLYLVTVISGLSGSAYDYYIEFNGSEVHLSQIISMTGTKEVGFKYGGILYNNLEFCVIRPFEK